MAGANGRKKEGRRSARAARAKSMDMLRALCVYVDRPLVEREKLDEMNMKTFHRSDVV